MPKMWAFLRLISAFTLCLGVLVVVSGVQNAGAVTTLTALGWCRGPMARINTSVTLPAASSITLPISLTLDSQVTSFTSLANQLMFLQKTAPTTSIFTALLPVANDALSTEGDLVDVTIAGTLASAQSAETEAIADWQSTISAWHGAAADTKRYCGAVGKIIAYVTNDWVSSCKLPKFTLHVRLSTGKTFALRFKQSSPGPWLIYSLSGGPVSGDSLPMWVQADWVPGKPDVGITSVSGTAGGCNEVSPGALTP
jgi:hypothetical protein